MTATGAALLPVVDALVAEPLTGLAVEALQAGIAAVTPQVARLQGWLSAAAGRLAEITGGTVPAVDDGRPRTVAGWLADVQHATSSAAGSQLRTARLLRSMPLVADAVLEGVLTPAQAAALTRFVDRIDTEALLESQPQLITVATALDPVQLGAWVSHAIATHCEPAAEAQEGRSRDKRFLTHRREADGTLSGRFVLTAEDSEVVLTALEPLARRAGLDDSRSAGQRRAGALVDALEQVVRHGDLPDAGGARPQLSYVLPADWAANAAEQAACADCGPRCADHQPLSFAATVAAALPGRPGVRAEQSCATGAWSGRRRAAASRRCSATPGSAASCSTRRGRCAAWKLSATRSPPRSAGHWPPAISAVPHVAAPDRRRRATPTTWNDGPTVARPRSTTWSCCAGGTTSCGTSASCACRTCTSRGTPTSARHTRHHRHHLTTPSC